MISLKSMRSIVSAVVLETQAPMHSQKNYSCAMDTLAERLKSVRAESGLSQQALAERCGVSQSTIAGIERGRNRRGSVMLPRIARSLGVRVLWLAEGIGPRREERDVLPNGKAAASSNQVTGASAQQVVATNDWLIIKALRDPLCREIVQMLLSTDEIGRQLVLGAARGALANHRPTTKNNHVQ